MPLNSSPDRLENEELDLSRFPFISDDFRFHDKNRVMNRLEASDWSDAVMNCWDEGKYDFLGWCHTPVRFFREEKDVLVLFCRKSDNAEYWYHSTLANLRAAQKTGKR